MKIEIKKNNTGKGCLLLFFLPFVLVGIGMLYMGLKDLYLQNKTSNWIPVEAHIKDVEFVYSDTHHGGDAREIKCNYNYTYKNKYYSNNKIANGYGMNSTENHEELYKLLRYANIVTAYVNPNSPKNSVLLKGVTSSTISVLITSILIFGFISVFFNIKNKVFFFTFFFIFIAGILLISSRALHTDFKEKIIVIKKKTKEEIEQINEKLIEEYLKE